MKPGCALRVLAVSLLGLVASPFPVQAMQVEALHALRFHVHASLIDPAAGEDLAFWQDVLDRALHQATAALQGHQGPADTACCTRIAADAALEVFGSPTDGFDVVNSGPEFAALRTTFGDGVYLIASLEVCGSSLSPSIVGCADTPGDFIVVDVTALDEIGLTIAHERGHNAGLLHPLDRTPPLVGAAPCLLMSAANGGGCLPSSDCAALRVKADSVGADCSCLGAAVDSAPVADGSVCTEESGCGLCSGGVCGACSGAAASRFVAAAGLDDPAAAVPDQLVSVSALSGGRSAAVAGLGGAVGDLAYDAGRDVLFAVRATPGGDDELIRIDPDSAAVLGVVGATGFTRLSGLAYEPATDRLLAVALEDEIFGTACADPQIGLEPPCATRLLRIDPETAASTSLGVLNQLLIPGGVEDLAWDVAGSRLFGTTAAGIFEIETSCPSGQCSSVSLVNPGIVTPSALAFDPNSGSLFQIGFGVGLGGLSVHRAVDPDTGATRAFMGVDGFTAGGLEVLPAPAPGATAGAAAAAGALWVLAIRRRGRPCAPSPGDARPSQPGRRGS